MELAILNIVFAGTIFLAMFIAMLLPTIMMKSTSPSTSQKRVLSCFNCIAGGVFLGMCFLGLIPSVQETVDDAMNSLVPNYNFPLSEFIIVIGFFLVLAVEQLCHTYMSHSSKIQSSQQNGNFSMVPTSMSSSILSDQDEVTLYSATDNENLHSRASHSANSHHGHSHNLDILSEHSGVQFLIFLAAVSVHSVFEGLALGLQTRFSKALHLFIGIITHELLMALALGMNVAQRRPKFMTSFKYALIFSVTIPFGIALGLLIKQTPGVAGNMTSGILQGFAAGVFLYVTFMEMMPMEFSHNGNNMMKVMFFFVGFLVVALINLILQFVEKD